MISERNEQWEARHDSTLSFTTFTTGPALTTALGRGKQEGGRGEYEATEVNRREGSLEMLVDT